MPKYTIAVTIDTSISTHRAKLTKEPGVLDEVRKEVYDQRPDLNNEPNPKGVEMSIALAQILGAIRAKIGGGADGYIAPATAVLTKEAHGEDAALSATGERSDPAQEWIDGEIAKTVERNKPPASDADDDRKWRNFCRMAADGELPSDLYWELPDSRAPCGCHIPN